MNFNTAISSLMVLTNALEKEKEVSREDFEIFVKLLAPLLRISRKKFGVSLVTKTQFIFPIGRNMMKI